jgi:glucose/arabinose dehydrogenase
VRAQVHNASIPVRKVYSKEQDVQTIQITLHHTFQTSLTVWLYMVPSSVCNAVVVVRLPIHQLLIHKIPLMREFYFIK